MVSVLRTLQAEWNALVPTAQALGIRRVRTLNLPLETIEYRRNKLEWLRGEIARLGGVAQRAQATTSLTPVAEVDLSVLTFGVELELLLPRGISRASAAAQVQSISGVVCNAEGYNHVARSGWKIVTDGSLGDYVRGAEVVSPVLRGEEGFRQVERVCNALKQMGCTVSKKCGLHVHIGARDFSIQTVKNLVLLYASAENTIDAFMAPSRRGASGGNGFCLSISIRNRTLLQNATTWDNVAVSIGQSAGVHNARGGGRYCKLNLQSYWQHGTVEFRHHQGTVEAEKTLNWVKTCLRMALAAQDGASAAASHDEFFAALKSPDAEKNFFAARRDFFANQATRNAARVERSRAQRSVFEAAAQDLQQRAFSRG